MASNQESVATVTSEANSKRWRCDNEFMDKTGDCPRKRGHSEPVIIPVAIVREGCSKISENIYELADHANRFLDFDKDIVSSRIAYILVIHAMDEAGKLLQIMRKMEVAERNCDDSIIVEGFYEHRLKGREAGTIGLLTIDWLDKVATELASKTGINLGNPFSQYRNHLEQLRQQFQRERERSLYVDLDDGMWKSPETPDESDIALDAYLLGALAGFTQLSISLGMSFSEISDFARQVSSLSLDELKSRLKNKEG